MAINVLKMWSSLLIIFGLAINILYLSNLYFKDLTLPQWMLTICAMLAGIVNLFWNKTLERNTKLTDKRRKQLQIVIPLFQAIVVWVAVQYAFFGKLDS